MSSLSLEGLRPIVSERIAPFFDHILTHYREGIHSLHLVGSAITPDFDEKRSDVNSVIVLHEFDFTFMRFLGSIGKKYKKAKIAAPLIMTPAALRDSLDVFPVEILTFKTIHKTVYGGDILKDLRVDLPHLRLQCEREMKTRLVSLRQGYISSLGDRDLLTGVLSRAITGTIPVFRGITHLLGKEPPAERGEVLKSIAAVISDHGTQAGIGPELEVFESVIAVKAGRLRPSGEELHALFQRYYHAIEAVDRLVDALHPPSE